jgi:glycosyltransferase involved in cell wall biosynthesis
MNLKDRPIDFCLLIPCYNNAEGLLVSLRSVNYPLQSFHTVIVDDGSKHPLTEKFIHDAMGEDFPLTLLINNKNEGIINSLNKGLKWITENVNAKYLARLDCGDVCEPERFQLQIFTLNNNPAIGLLGSWCVFANKNRSMVFEYVTPVDHQAIIKAMHFRNVFIHPTVMFRLSLLQQTGYYPEKFEFVEDFALFWKMIKLEQSLIISKCLVTCEINPSGISMKNRVKQLKGRWKVVRKFAPDFLLRCASYVRLMILFFIPANWILKLKVWRSRHR